MVMTLCECHHIMCLPAICSLKEEAGGDAMHLATLEETSIGLCSLHHCHQAVTQLSRAALFVLQRHAPLLSVCMLKCQKPILEQPAVLPTLQDSPTYWNGTSGQPTLATTSSLSVQVGESCAAARGAALQQLAVLLTAVYVVL